MASELDIGSTQFIWTIFEFPSMQTNKLWMKFWDPMLLFEVLTWHSNAFFKMKVKKKEQFGIFKDEIRFKTDFESRFQIT